MHLRAFRRVIASLAILAATTTAALGAPFTQACVAAVGLNNNQFLCGVDSAAPTTLSGEQIGVSGQPINAGAASALAQFGILKVETSATNILLGSGASSTAFARSSDTLAISSANLNGTQGFVDFRIDYSWAFSNDLSGSAGQNNIADVVVSFAGEVGNARLQIADSGTGSVDYRAQPIVTSPNATAVDAILGSFFTVRIPFTFGVESFLNFDLFAQSAASGGATASIDAFNSAYWGGMVVRDQNLNPVAFTAASGSGTDYTKSYLPETPVAVPEPSTLGLLALALTALAMFNKRPRGWVRDQERAAASAA